MIFATIEDASQKPIEVVVFNSVLKRPRPHGWKTRPSSCKDGCPRATAK